MMMSLLITSLWWSLNVVPTDVQIEDTTIDRGKSYALIVASNEGGPGQATLEFAERDADRIAEVLSTLGNVASGRITMLKEPSTNDVFAALDSLEQEVRADERRGIPTRVFFYYSGHAKANALNLGDDALPLSTLRQRLMGLSSTLKIVILDACQSGAFSGIKGAEPAADFSVNSVSQLNTQGVAVLASSSGTELSQESSQLESSHFTHHFVVALRGAGDTNADGRVTLDEAYSYAYNGTLESTAKTAVGKQHVTLERDLSGKGDVPLTYVQRAEAFIEIPGDVSGSLLIQSLPSKTVVADVSQRSGQTLLLGVATGAYQAIVRKSDSALLCEFDTERGATTVVQTSGCEEVVYEDVTAKGGFRGPAWAVEVMTGLGWAEVDDFNRTLQDFGYNAPTESETYPQVSVAVSRRLNGNWTVGVKGATLEYDRIREYDYVSNTSQRAEQTYEWETYALSGQARFGVPLFNERLRPFVQAGVGVGLALAQYERSIDASDSSLNATNSKPDLESYWGLHAEAAVGVIWMPWEHVGFQMDTGYAYTPALSNLLSDVHNGGGWRGSFGLRVAL